MDYFAAPDRYEGEGFTLRCYRPDDGPALREATLESYAHLSPWMPWASERQTPEEAERLVRQFQGRWLLATDFTAAVFGPEGTLLGGTGFHLRGKGFATRSAEVGMWIRSSAAGQGLGTRVLEAMLSWGFSDAWPWTRLTWHCDAQNLGSKRVAEKCGLRLEATLIRNELGVDDTPRDTLMFALLESERE
ncbi:MAG: GNAT family N-acetyltransferase [Planctomycetes bacterium]|nr:GNAT family N-acetyltransferase [Planctomycetota bacterium]